MPGVTVRGVNRTGSVVVAVDGFLRDVMHGDTTCCSFGVLERPQLDLRPAAALLDLFVLDFAFGCPAATGRVVVRDVDQAVARLQRHTDVRL